MGSPSELVEAHTFERRRFTGALVSGSDRLGREDRQRPVRAVVGGLALAVLLCAGAVVARLLSPGPPDDWTSRGLIVSADTGQAFVIVPEDAHEGADEDAGVELRPVANLTSARLVLGSDVEPAVVSQEAIDGQRVGPEIGVPDAPTSPPPPALLVQTGWSACPSGAQRPLLRLGGEAPRPVAGAAQVVAVDGRSYLVADVQVDGEPPAAYSLPLPDTDAVDNLLVSLGLPARVLASRVPRAWLDLVPTGAPLTWASFGLSGAGTRPAGWDAAGVPGRATVGDVLVDPVGEAVVMTRAGPAGLDPFAAAVYGHTRMPTGSAPALIPVRRLPDLARVRWPAGDLHWPTRLPVPLGSDPCAVLVADGDSAAVVRLGTRPEDDAGSDAPGVHVDPGHGALVRDMRAGHDSVAVLVDSAGLAHPVEGEDTLERLGYADVVPPTVPHAWMRLFAAGAPLSRDRALCGRVSCG
ncbi:type VII secretion protein EccB [Nocardioides sp.]|uniref:type VII secretion protein EccB n=1 Tax=Nocardioides sp. TaxID=35761 RepID=UPI0025D124CA|nr:type VII secretion protein EccB [Nocardioides sp.]